MASPLLGAWQLVSDSHEGMMIYTQTHYCNVTVRKGRKQISDQPTESEEAEAYRTIGASAGTYVIKGSVATRREEIDRIPQDHVDDADFEFTIAGHVLTWQYVAPDGARGPAATYHRVE